MSWVFLALAIVFEIIGTISLKNNTLVTGPRILPWLLVIIYYVLCYFFLSLAIKKIPTSVAYAIWSGLGIVSLAIFDYYVFDVGLTVSKIIAFILIITGIVVLNLAGGH